VDFRFFIKKDFENVYSLKSYLEIPQTDEFTAVEKKSLLKLLVRKNFKRVFLKTMFLKMAVIISQDVLNRLISNLECTFSLHVVIGYLSSVLRLSKKMCLFLIFWSVKDFKKSIFN
jgi:hypothetical protein